jgi:hypothetical protein
LPAASVLPVRLTVPVVEPAVRRDQKVAGSERIAGQIDGAGGRAGGVVLGLLGLLHGRQGLLEQAGQAGEAVVGGFKRLRALSNLIELCAQVVGAVVQRLRLEIAGRIVEGGVDLLAGRKMLLRRCEIGGGILQRKQILPNSLTQGDIRHGRIPILDQAHFLACICTLLPLMMRKAIPALIGGLPAEGFAGGALGRAFRNSHLSAARIDTGGARSHNAAELRR